MTLNETILQELTSLRKEVKSLKSMLVKEGKTEVWVSEKEAAAILGIGKDSMRKKRYAGLTPQFRMRPNGRGVQYRKSDIEAILITTT